MARSGMRAIKSVNEEHKRSGGGGQYTRRLVLGDGDSADVLFIGAPDTEPFISREHTVRDGKRFDSIVCREKSCPSCNANAGGDKRVGRAAPKFNFTVFDLRFQRKKLNEKKTKEAGNDRFDYTFVDEEKVSPKGIRKGIFFRSGKCGWSMPPQWAVAIDGVNEQWKKKCKSCGKGRITVDGYETEDGSPCSKKASKMDEDELQDALDNGSILEVISCSRCDEPVRTNIFNSIVRVTRTGEGKNTTYQFQLMPMEDVPDDVAELLEEEANAPYEWDELKAAMSASAMSEKLGIRNPFKNEKDDDEKDDAEEYDEDDDEDDDPFADDDDEDDDEDDEPVKKKSSKKGSTKVLFRKKGKR